MGDAADRRDSFGAQLRQDRMAAGLTQEELAEKSGLSVRAIGDMERGRTSRPRPSTLRQIAQALSRPAPGHEVAEPARPVVSIPSAFSPRELPAPVRHFIGRDPELAALNRLRDQAGDHGPETVVISAIGGAAGVGKTALAVRWAHQVQDQFPDGQLYVNLRGYDPGQPVSASDALAGFLRALGMAGQDIPAEADERAARYRSLLAGRRMLILLDNARDAEQVRPLLPATPGCMALVTSRDALVGLVARDGAQRLDLEPLTMPDAVGLLQALIGGRIDDDPGAAATLAAQCSRLPLALRIAAELAAARPAASVAELTTELANQQRRLDLLDADGDPRVALRAVFSWSYQRLDITAACAFRLLGLHPGPDFDPYVVATLTRTTIGRARQVLDVLARAHLIQPSGPGRHDMHDLLRAYAAERAIRCDSEQVRRAALTRLFDLTWPPPPRPWTPCSPPSSLV